jgi:hypothetical protein
MNDRLTMIVSTRFKSEWYFSTGQSPFVADVFAGSVFSRLLIMGYGIRNEFRGSCAHRGCGIEQMREDLRDEQRIPLDCQLLQRGRCSNNAGVDDAGGPFEEGIHPAVSMLFDRFKGPAHGCRSRTDD